MSADQISDELKRKRKMYRDIYKRRKEKVCSKRNVSALEPQFNLWLLQDSTPLKLKELIRDLMKDDRLSLFTPKLIDSIKHRFFPEKQTTTISQHTNITTSPTLTIRTIGNNFNINEQLHPLEKNSHIPNGFTPMSFMQHCSNGSNEPAHIASMDSIPRDPCM